MKFSGIYAAMLTPFEDDSGKLSINRIEKLCSFLIDSGVNGLFILGTTGEGLLLSIEERMDASEVILEVVNKRIPVIIHTGALSTAETIELTVHARAIKADAAAAITPSFYRVGEDAIFDHYTSIAGYVKDFPLFIYNLPSFTNNDVSPDLLLKIAKKSENITGIKYSSSNIEQFKNYRRLMGRDFHIFMGDDSMVLQSLLAGGNGCVSGNASIYPELITEIYSLFLQDRKEEALSKQKELNSFTRIHGEGAVLDHFKTILRFRGIDTGRVRAPLQRTSVEEARDIMEKISKMKINVVREKNARC